MFKTTFICIFVLIVSCACFTGAYSDTAETTKEIKPQAEKIDLTGDEETAQPAREWGGDVEDTWDEDSSWGDPFTEEGDDATKRALGYDGDGEND